MKIYPTQQGFTLLELMIVLGILGIFAMLAMPSFSDMIVSQRIKAASYDLYADLIFARSEAIKRNQNVTVSPIGTGGWTIADAGGTIRTRSAYTDRIAFTSDPAAKTSIVYMRSGRPTSDTGKVTFFIDDSQGKASILRRCVYLDSSGRPSTKREGEGSC